MKFDASKKSSHDNMRPSKRRKKHVAVGLSLEKFAGAKVSRYDKREVLQKRHEERVIQHGKFKKLQKRLEARGILESVPAVDNVGLLEAELGVATAEGAAHGRVSLKGAQRDGGPGKKHQKLQRAPAENVDARGGEASARAAPSDEEQPGPSTHRPDERGKKRQQHGDETETVEKGKPWKKQRPPSQLQRMADKAQAKKEEEMKTKEEAAKEKAERLAKVQAAQKARKKEKANYFKRNSKGQPLMKYRMEKLLHQIERGS